MKKMNDNIQLNKITKLTIIKQENKEIKKKLFYLIQKINQIFDEKEKKEDLREF